MAITRLILDIRLQDAFAMALPLEPDTVDEGVCVRIDAITPRIYKAKSPKFLEHETKILDRGEADLESITA